MCIAEVVVRVAGCCPGGHKLNLIYSGWCCAIGLAHTGHIKLHIVRTGATACRAVRDSGGGRTLSRYCGKSNEIVIPITMAVHTPTL